MWIGILLTLFRMSRADLIGLAVWMAVVFALAVLGSHYRLVDRAVKSFFMAVSSFFGWMFLTLLPLWAFDRASRIVLERFSLGFEIAAFTV